MGQMNNSMFTGKRVTIMGLGFFGGSIGLAKYLASQGARITITDLKGADHLAASVEALAGLPIRFVLGRHETTDFTAADVVFVSPAVPKDSRYVAAARSSGVPIDTEMNLFVRLCPGTIVGVTGSNGKTTTTSLIGALFQAHNPRTRVGGNIGRSLLPELAQIAANDPIVLELSSFQLEDLAEVKRSPHIALLLNLAPNHLDRHGSMEGYLAAKTQIFAYQTPTDVAILNADDAQVAALATSLAGRVQSFSLRGPVEYGSYLDGERLCLVHGGMAQEVCRVQDLRLLGRHNVANVLAALAAADAWGVPPVLMGQAIRGFSGVEHRLERVRELRGVTFYNDSIATSPAATLAALTAIEQPIMLIAGGYDKGLPFEALAEAVVQRVKALFLIGNTAAAMAHAVRTAPRLATSAPTVTVCGDLRHAVHAAYGAAAPGDVVLLSPACASYDQFLNFVERGHLFKRYVAALDDASATLTPDGRGRDAGYPVPPAQTPACGTTAPGSCLGS
jgi:UDP-N-acetylmuramoylalanine--D-glutamate ligase